MEIYNIPFQGQFILYRPLVPLAFIANGTMVAYIEQRLAGSLAQTNAAIEGFLRAIGFWEPDPPAPTAWRPQDEHRPTTAVLLMTSTCNLRCSYCYAFGGEGPRRAMTSEIARKVIDAAYENALERGREEFSVIFHGGGEPTANWPVLVDAVAHAETRGLPCEITMATNGVLSEQKREFVVAHMSGVSLSCDGNRDVQDAQRPTAGGGGSFDRVMETIRAFDRARFAYSVRITLTPSTFGTLAESVGFLCEETRCQAIQVEPTYSGARGGHVDPTPEEAEAFIASFLEALETAHRAGKPLFYSGAMPWQARSSFCRAAGDALVATPDGDLVGCVEIHDRTHPLSDRFRIGHVASARDGATAGKGGPLPVLPDEGIHIDSESLRRFAEAEIAAQEQCRRCHCYRHCAGDCATRRSVSAGPDRGRCHVNRRITKDILAWLIAANGGVWHGTRPVLPKYLNVEI